MADGFARSILARVFSNLHCYPDIRRLLSRVLTAGLLSIVLITNSCDRNGGVGPRIQVVSGHANLENQSDHSGVLLTITDLDSTAVTDSTGFFSFSGIPDGVWQLRAIYPFFETDTIDVELVNGLLQSPIEITLRQLLQFWIEPTDTTISMSASAWDDRNFRMEFRGYFENVSDDTVTIICSLTPFKLLAIRPLEAASSKYCDELYGWLAPSDFIDWLILTLEPGAKVMDLLGRGYWFKRECFEPGSYEVYWCLNDNFNYRDHFEPYTELNWTLMQKRELLRPGSLALIE